MPDKRTLLIYGGLGLGAVMLVALALKNARGIGTSIGAAVPNLAAGIVQGVGSGIGIPNTSDPDVVSRGRAALRAGDWWTASLNLPAGEFLAAVSAKLFGSSGALADASQSQTYIVTGQNTTTNQPGTGATGYF